MTQLTELQRLEKLNNEINDMMYLPLYYLRESWTRLNHERELLIAKSCNDIYKDAIDLHNEAKRDNNVTLASHYDYLITQIVTRK